MLFLQYDFDTLPTTSGVHTSLPLEPGQTFVTAEKVTNRGSDCKMPLCSLVTLAFGMHPPCYKEAQVTWRGHVSAFMLPASINHETYTGAFQMTPAPATDCSDRPRENRLLSPLELQANDRWVLSHWVWMVSYAVINRKHAFLGSLPKPTKRTVNKDIKDKENARGRAYGNCQLIFGPYNWQSRKLTAKSWQGRMPVRHKCPCPWRPGCLGSPRWN